MVLKCLKLVLIALLIMTCGLGYSQEVSDDQGDVNVQQDTEQTIGLEAIEQVDSAKVKDSGVELANMNGARLEFVDIEKDLGDVGPKSKHMFSYEFKNTGDKKLIISHVQSTCGCTIPELSKKDYEPGESGRINVTYEASSREGDTSKKIYVHSNDSINPRIGLTIKSNTVLKVSVFPKKFDLSLVEPNAGMGKIYLKSVDGQEFAIKKLEVAGKAVSCEFDPLVRASEFTLEPVVDFENLAKNLDGVIKISIDHPECDLLMVSYNTKPKYEVTPARILFLNAKPGDKQKRELWIKSNYTDKVEIDSITMDKNTLEVIDSEERGAMIKLTVEMTAPEKEDAASKLFTDELQINLKNGEKLEVKCSGWYKKNI